MLFVVIEAGILQQPRPEPPKAQSTQLFIPLQLLCFKACFSGYAAGASCWSGELSTCGQHQVAF